jgi:hypothetical protein
VKDLGLVTRGDWSSFVWGIVLHLHLRLVFGFVLGIDSVLANCTAVQTVCFNFLPRAPEPSIKATGQTGRLKVKLYNCGLIFVQCISLIIQYAG